MRAPKGASRLPFFSRILISDRHSIKIALELLRKCPNCGRRFSVKLERRDLVEQEKDTVRVVHDVTLPRLGYSDARLAGAFTPIEAVAEEVPIERDTFKLTYICGHCRHEWSEIVPVVKKMGKDGPISDTTNA
jgi:hypothetical protein